MQQSIRIRNFEQGGTVVGRDCLKSDKVKIDHGEALYQAKRCVEDPDSGDEGLVTVNVKVNLHKLDDMGEEAASSSCCSVEDAAVVTKCN